MRFPNVLYFSALALLTTSNADVNPRSIESSLSVSSHNASAQPSEAHSDQRPRTGDPVNEENDEERGLEPKRIIDLDILHQLVQPSALLDNLNIWLRHEKPPGRVFEKLELNKASEQLFADPKHRAWAAHEASVDDFDPGAAVLLTLRKHVSEDKLIDKLVEVEKTAASDIIFSKLYEEWLSSSKSPEDVLMILGVNRAKSDDLEYAAFARWLTYLDRYSKVHRQSERGTMKMLTKRLGTHSLPRLLEKSETKTAKTMMARLPHLWVAEHKTPDEMFEELLLVWGDDNLLDSVEFKTWSKFINLFNEANPEQATSVIKVMIEKFGDEKAAKILIASSEVSGTEQVARELLAMQISIWHDDNKPSQFVFEMLQLEKNKNVITNPRFSLWVKYVDADTQRKSVIAVLRLSYEDYELAKMVVEAKKIKGAAVLAERVKLNLFGEWVRVVPRWHRRKKVRKALRLDKPTESVMGYYFRGIYRDFLAHVSKLASNGKDKSGIPSMEVDNIAKRIKEAGGKKKANAIRFWTSTYDADSIGHIEGLGVRHREGPEPARSAKKIKTTQ